MIAITQERCVPFSCSGDGATIVSANKEARKPEKAIDGDDDSYMKNSCSAKKWIIIELSQVSTLTQECM